MMSLRGGRRGDRRGNLMKCIYEIAAVAFGSFAMTASLFAAAPKISIPPIDFKPGTAERLVLKNGVIVYLKEDHELPTFDLSIRMKTSPADETVPESLVFMADVWRTGGTQKRTPEQLNDALEFMATGVGTFADYESAGASVSCLSKNIPQSMAILMDVFFHPAFREEQLSLSKAKALESLKRKNETPAQIGRRAFRDVIYGKNHLYAHEPNEQSVTRVKRADLVALHKRVLAPDRAMITISGDFKKDEMIALLETYFADWKKTGRVVPSYDYAIKDAPKSGIFLVDKDFNQSRVSMGRIGISRHSPERYAMLLTNDILGGGGPSRLFGEIRSRQGLAYVVASFFVNPIGPGMSGVICQTKSESVTTAIKAIQKELDKFTAGPIRGDEIALAKESNSNSFVFGFDSAEQIVAARAMNEFNEFPPDEIDKFLNKLQAVTPVEIAAIGQKYFAKEGMTIVVVGDKKKFKEPLSTLGPVVEIPLADVN